MSEPDLSSTSAEGRAALELKLDPAPTRRFRRTWPQRVTLVVVWLTALACFLAAGALALGQWVLSSRPLAELAQPVQQREGNADVEVVVPDAPGEPAPTTPSATTTTLVDVPLLIAEPDAANFLVVGADNRECVGDTPSEERRDVSERSDTIMIWRVNPITKQLAVLSLPRDLYVEFPRGGKDRINSAYRRDDPTLLQNVIDLNFEIPIDHYIQVDFCAFRRLVDAVGGIAIPFEYPARDWQGRNRDGTPKPFGFIITETGCVNLNGAAALGYVRSRHYQYEDPPGSGNWISDPTSDFGRIRRQQDFLRRVLVKIVDEGLFDPDVAAALIETNRKYVVYDDELSVREMLEFANALRNFDPNSVATYRIESSNDEIDGESIEHPRIRGQNMRAILSIFRGEATLASAPEQVFETTTTLARPTTTDDSSESSDESSDDESSDESSDDESNGDESSSDESSSDESTDSTLPEVEASENAVGIAPDRAVNCD